MSSKLTAIFAAAGLMATSGAVAAQTAAPRNESAQQNVRQSEQYDSLVCSNKAFRAKRIAQECGPITDAQLHAQCLSSFSDCGATVQKPNWRKAPPSETTR